MEAKSEKERNQKKEEKSEIMEFYIGNTRCVSDFEKIGEIGEGTFGTVCN
jgi:hypothetical protein